LRLSVGTLISVGRRCRLRLIRARPLSSAAAETVPRCCTEVMRAPKRSSLLLAAFSALACLSSAGMALAGRSAGFTASSSNPCPIRDHVLPKNENALANSILVPMGATQVAVCRYYGLDSWPPGLKHRSRGGGGPSPWAGRLARSAVVGNPRRLKRLTRLFDELGPVEGGRVYHCPEDDGSEILAIFAYTNAAADPVRVSLRGCRWATNGLAEQTYWTSQPLRNELLSLTRLRRVQGATREGHRSARRRGPMSRAPLRRSQASGESHHAR
jgi:hypothetical protein